MGIEISIQKDYIQVEPPNGISYWEILEGIGRLMNMDGYREKTSFGNSVTVRWFSHMMIYSVKIRQFRFYPRLYIRYRQPTLRQRCGFRLSIDQNQFFHIAFANLK